jgi:hypothetical protein
MEVLPSSNGKGMKKRSISEISGHVSSSTQPVKKAADPRKMIRIDSKDRRGAMEAFVTRVKTIEREEDQKPEKEGASQRGEDGDAAEDTPIDVTVSLSTCPYQSLIVEGVLRCKHTKDRKSIPYTSIKILSSRLTSKMSQSLTSMLRSSVYVGVVDHELSLIQYKTQVGGNV